MHSTFARNQGRLESLSQVVNKKCLDWEEKRHQVYDEMIHNNQFDKLSEALCYSVGYFTPTKDEAKVLKKTVKPFL